MKVSRIHVENFVILRDVLIEPEEGLNVFTGETGAGKSLIVGAMGLIMGRRASPHMIRKGADRAEVEVVVEGPFPEEVVKLLEEAGIGKDDSLILRRVLRRNSSQAFVNEKAVTAQFLSKLTENTFELSLQGASFSLRDPSCHINIFDAYAGTYPVRAEYEKLYRRYREILRKLEEIYREARERERRKDVLRYEIQEIESACLREGEEEELRQKAEYLKNIENLRLALSSFHSKLYGDEGSAYELIAGAVKDLSSVRNLSEEITSLSETAEGAGDAIKEAALSALNLLESLETEEGDISEVQSRLALIERLKRKYGGSVREILSYLEKARVELEDLESCEVMQSDLETEKIEIQRKLSELAGQLTHMRVKGVKYFEEEVMSQLSELGLDKSAFKVIMRKSRDFTPAGVDELEFTFTANPDTELLPLSRTASGGELARIYIALKSVVKGRGEILIFDEVDAGIGGVTAEVVAQKMKEMGSGRQIFLITHRAQIAAAGNAHFRVNKFIKGGRTEVIAQKLEGEERVKEVAKLLSGRITDTSLKHAREILEGKTL